MDLDEMQTYQSVSIAKLFIQRSSEATSLLHRQRGGG